MTTVTGKTKAWLTPYSGYTPQDVVKPNPAIINHVVYSDGDMTANGWTLVGEATIAFTPISADELIGNKVAALRAEAANIRAEATAKCARIEDQINQLLCLEFTPAEPAPQGDDIPDESEQPCMTDKFWRDNEGSNP